VGMHTFNIYATEAAQLVPVVTAGDFCYRSDLDKYYVNTTGASGSMAEYQEVIPQDEPNDTLYVASEVAQLALSIVIGNISVRTDTNKCYVNITGTNTVLATDWIEIDTPVKI